MIQVPAELENEILKLRGRHLKVKCRLDFSDVTIDNTIIGYANSKNNLDTYDQLFNGKTSVSFKVFSLDGSCKLDGTYHLAPDNISGRQRYEVGWWSDDLSLHDNRFAHYEPKGFGDIGFGDQAFGSQLDYPSVFVNFLERQISKIEVYFDDAREEYAVDFDIILYSADNTVLYTHSVTNNSGYNYVTSITTVVGVAMMECKIKKWSSAHKNAKVCEMFTLISEEITADDIYSLNVTEERELSDKELPLGTTSAGSITLSFFNRDRLYDWDNTSSKLYNYIRKGIKIMPFVGDGVNWIPLGMFFAEEWDIPKDDIVVTLEGLDRMAMLGDSVYSTNEAIVAPDDQTYTVDTNAEWGSATLNDVIVENNTIRMRF